VHAARTPTRIALAIAFACFVVHVVAAAAGGYGFFRDELYFIDCGRHPAFGYVDQPPLVPLVAAATQAFGHSLVLLRAVAGLGHALFVVATASLAAVVAEEAQAQGGVARVTAAAAAALSPMFYGLTSTLNTTAFEPAAWTAVALYFTRAARSGDARPLVAAGAVAGVALEAKYAIPFFLAPLLAGVAIGPARRILVTRHAAIGAALAVAIAAPSALWQLANGLPFLELLHAASHGKNIVVPPLDFLANQLLVMNPALAPLWIGGVAYALFARRLARLRFLPIAFAGVLVAMLVLHGKDYYVAPAYGVAFALGAAAFAAHTSRTLVRVLCFVPAFALMLVAAPMAMPILAPPSLVAYMARLSAQPQAQEHNQKGAVLPQLHADMLGWPELEARVAEAWRALPPEDRAKGAIIASNYGEAGAINFFGAADGLPRARSGHNQYGRWGPGDHDGSVILRVNGDLARYEKLCDEARVVAAFGGPYVMPYEHERPIVLCRGLRTDLRAMWKDFVFVE
jgi:hypothetical protein